MNEVLTAAWSVDQDPMIDPPNDVKWGNGAPATQEDYLDHMLDTHSWLVGETEIELRMFPTIVAHARYDLAAETWVIHGVGPNALSLEVADPYASDDQIIAALFVLPIVFRAQIHR